MKLTNKLLLWFYSTPIGGLYFDLLLWIDRQKDNGTRYLSPKQAHQIIRQAQHCAHGVERVKEKVNALVKTRNKDEYHRVLTEMQNLVSLAERESDPEKAKLMEMLQKAFGKVVDVETATDRAKMIDQRINDMHDLHSHIKKRNLMREIRKLRGEGKAKEADKLEKEWLEKYGRSGSRHRFS
jgi:phosphoribosylanthranilate isomerase